MAGKIKREAERLTDHYAALSLAFAVAALSAVGVGDSRVVGVLGLLLCAAGMTLGGARADPWILIPLILYDAAALASSWAVYGNAADGYGPLHALFPVIYLLTACLDEPEQRLLRRCCALWAGGVAAAAILRFVFRAAVLGRAARLAGLLGNPNALGSFLVVGWFALMHCVEEEPQGAWDALLSRAEPVVLTALAMTLSMGSFLAMAAGVCVLLLEKKRAAPWGGTLRFACRLLARAVLGMGIGLMLYLAAARTSVPWVCVPLLLYGAAAALCWKTLDRFLEARPRTALALSALGLLVAAAALALRPSAAATFAERLEMMRSGARYLARDPLLGVGPFQWRALDLNDGGTYFNTWHIHNIPLHIGVETGWPAMAMILTAGLRALCKRKAPCQRAGAAAFAVHNLIDTGFFYLGVTALALTAGEPGAGAKRLGGAAVKAIFALFAALFGYSLYHTIGSGV